MTKNGIIEPSNIPGVHQLYTYVPNENREIRICVYFV